MACLVVDGPWGERELPEGRNGNVQGMRPGEKILRVKWDCGECAQGDQGATIKEQLEHEGIKWGSAVAWAAGKMGFKKCTACAAREYMLNHVRENGWAETLRLIKTTF